MTDELPMRLNDVSDSARSLRECEYRTGNGCAIKPEGCGMEGKHLASYCIARGLANQALVIAGYIADGIEGKKFKSIN